MRDIKNLLRKLLVRMLEDLEADNTNLTEEEAIELVGLVKEYSMKNPLMSKYQAYNYLGVSRATFDNYVREGKISKGIKKQGWKELGWYKKELDRFISERH